MSLCMYIHHITQASNSLDEWSQCELTCGCWESNPRLTANHLSSAPYYLCTVSILKKTSTRDNPVFASQIHRPEHPTTAAECFNRPEYPLQPQAHPHHLKGRSTSTAGSLFHSTYLSLLRCTDSEAGLSRMHTPAIPNRY